MTAEWLVFAVIIAMAAFTWGFFKGHAAGLKHGKRIAEIEAEIAECDRKLRQRLEQEETP